MDGWYLTALNFCTGRTEFRRLAGTGLGYNNNYAPVSLGPDGAAYVGVLGGLVRLADATSPSGARRLRQAGLRAQAAAEAAGTPGAARLPRGGPDRRRGPRAGQAGGVPGRHRATPGGSRRPFRRVLRAPRTQAHRPGVRAPARRPGGAAHGARAALRALAASSRITLSPSR